MSWLVAGLGFLLGLLPLTFIGLAYFGITDNAEFWISLFGIALFIVTFLSGSVVAIYNRRGGAWIFLALMPFGVYGLTQAGPHEKSFPLTALGLTAAIYLPFYAAFFARRSLRRAGWTFAITAAISAVVLFPSQWTPGLLLAVAGLSLLYLPFATFWWWTHQRQWPPLRSNPGTLRVVCLACSSIVALEVVMTFVISAMTSSIHGGDCRIVPIPVQPSPTGRAAFTARVLYTGTSLSERMRNRNLPYPQEKLDPRLGNWAIAWVEDEFGGLSQWEPRLVLLTNFLYWQGERYFVDASRAHGLVRSLLPIFSGDLGCSRTGTLQQATVELRSLRQPPTEGTRLIGSVSPPPLDSEVHNWLEGPPVQPQYAPGVRIEVKGPSGTSIVTTDPTGIYQANGLPEGDYELTPLLPENQLAGFFDRGSNPAKVQLRNGQPAGYGFRLYWNGRIEGRVTDRSGAPLQIGVTIRNAEGSQLPGYLRDTVDSAADGSYRLRKIPPGRYRVILNAYGPALNRPYDVQEYGKVITLGKGELATSIDFVTTRLAERKVRVHVTGPGFLNLEGAQVCLMHEHTSGYERFDGAYCYDTADVLGDATIRIHGQSRVRLFSVHRVPAQDNGSPEVMYRSQVIESPADRIPSQVELILKPATK